MKSFNQFVQEMEGDPGASIKWSDYKPKCFKRIKYQMAKGKTACAKRSSSSAGDE